MKKSLFTIMGIVLMLFMVGCTPATGVAVPSQPGETAGGLPSWYVNPPDDDASSYFGAGDGRTKREAHNSALSQIAAKISLSVKSTMQSSQRSYRSRQGGSDTESTRESREQKIEAVAREVEFANAKVMNTVFLTNRFYTLVEVDREEMFKRYYGKLARLEEKISQKHAFAKTQPLFSRIVLLDAIEGEIDGATLQFPLLKSLNTSFDEAPFYRRFDAIHAENQAEKSRLVVGFKPTEADSIQTSVKEHLSALGIQAVSGTQALEKYKVSDVAVIAIEKEAVEQHFKTTSAQLADLHFAQLSISFTVYDGEGNVLSRNTVKVRNSSGKSFADAAQKRDKFDQLAEEKGILTLLSGKL